MARIKGGMNAKRKHNKVLKLAKGYRGASHGDLLDTTFKYAILET